MQRNQGKYQLLAVKVYLTHRDVSNVLKAGVLGHLPSLAVLDLQAARQVRRCGDGAVWRTRGRPTASRQARQQLLHGGGQARAALLSGAPAVGLLGCTAHWRSAGRRLRRQ